MQTHPPHLALTSIKMHRRFRSGTVPVLRAATPVVNITEQTEHWYNCLRKITRKPSVRIRAHCFFFYHSASKHVYMTAWPIAGSPKGVSINCELTLTAKF